MDPLVSILIPAYNEGEFLAETLKSALEQTWQRKEIIVVDDGSTDNTAAIAEGFASSGVRILRQTHQGAAAARNKAYSVCRGDYIQWLDADDLLSPDKISGQLCARSGSEHTKVLFSSPWGRFKYRRERAEFTPTCLWCDLLPQEWLLRKLENNLFMQTATWLVSRDLSDAAGPWNAQLSLDDDGEYFTRVALLSEGIRFIPEGRVFYRFSGAGSLSSVGWSNEKIESLLQSMDLTIRHFRSIDDGDRARHACLTYLQTNLGTFLPARPDLALRIDAIAAELGGQLEKPQLPWKYSWLARMLGDRPAKWAQILLPRFKWSMVRYWDKALFRLEAARRAR
jgi:glycosyltransferase involved in cell wall biosynthesis